MKSEKETHVVTGASAGIGLEVARGLARSGARVVLACRDQGRAEAARDSIQKDVADAELDLLIVDFSSQASIRRAAGDLAKRHPVVDVLVNNAAVVSKTQKVSPDGIELVFATNVLGYHLFTALLRPLTVAARAGRIINVASMMAYGLELDDVEWKRRRYDASGAYAQSKQANRMLTWALARRLEGTRVTANAMHPGAVSTQLLHSLFAGMRGRTTEKGAETAVWLATSPDVAGVTGRFWTDMREVPCSFHDEAAEEALVRLCDRMTGL
jgi:NAD(P)-dependent dehydrogenase (short-subunit alcohol dehydrogenase family)